LVLKTRKRWDVHQEPNFSLTRIISTDEKVFFWVFTIEDECSDAFAFKYSPTLNFVSLQI
jgi:hypothetical protein